MAFKFVAFFACLAVASAGNIRLLETPVAHVAQPVLAKTEDFDPNPQYNFGYDVQDAISGDNKNQVESREGDVVHGQYSLNDADGYRRIVDYTADPVNGFNAVVRREPLGAVAVKTVVKTAAAPVAYAAAPALIKTAPVAYAAAPAIVKSAAVPLAYSAAPALVKTHYTAPALLKTTYAAPALIKSAPAVTYSAGPALVKTSYSSPIISYAY